MGWLTQTTSLLFALLAIWASNIIIVCVWMTESWRNCNRSPLSGKENQDEQHCTLPKEWFGAKARGQMYKTVPHLSVNEGRNVYIDYFQNICSSSSTSAINWRNSEKGRKGELLYLMFLPLESGLNKHYWRKRLLCNSKGTRQGWKKRRSGQTTNVRKKSISAQKKAWGQHEEERQTLFYLW